MAKKDPADKKFESALEELESVVEQLESGDLSSRRFSGRVSKGRRTGQILQPEIE